MRGHSCIFCGRDTQRFRFNRVLLLKNIFMLSNGSHMYAKVFAQTDIAKHSVSPRRVYDVLKISNSRYLYGCPVKILLYFTSILPLNLLFPLWHEESLLYLLLVLWKFWPNFIVFIYSINCLFLNAYSEDWC